jgi:sugar/nucleoside kinase (ribokinase family)
MVTVQGVESRLQGEDFDAIASHPGDIVYVSGYELLYPHGPALVAWVKRNRPGRLVFDPGPLIESIDAAALTAILGATHWLSLNATEAEKLTGANDPAVAAVAALEQAPDAAGVVIRTGAAGCVVVERGGEVVAVPPFPAAVLDTTGAGDTHVGAFVAALAHGLDPREACRWGNAAASVVVASHGQVSPPRLDALRSLLDADS